MMSVILVCGTVNAQTEETSYYSTRHEVGVTIGAGSNTENPGGLAYNGLSRDMFLTSTSLNTGETVSNKTG